MRPTPKSDQAAVASVFSRSGLLDTSEAIVQGIGDCSSALFLFPFLSEKELTHVNAQIKIQMKTPASVNRPKDRVAVELTGEVKLVEPVVLCCSL
jgi:hypothetical protein